MPRITRLSVIFFLTACSMPDPASIRAEIEMVIEEGVEATRRQDIDTYMRLIPEASVIHDEAGSVVTRDRLRAKVLRDWSIIDQTLAISVALDSLSVDGDSAVVFTSQRWERLMFRPDGVTLDTVLTTQMHRESWRITPAGWRNFLTVELGGRIWINGEPYFTQRDVN